MGGMGGVAKCRGSNGCGWRPASGDRMRGTLLGVDDLEEGKSGEKSGEGLALLWLVLLPVDPAGDWRSEGWWLLLDERSKRPLLKGGGNMEEGEGASFFTIATLGLGMGDGSLWRALHITVALSLSDLSEDGRDGEENRCEGVVGGAGDADDGEMAGAVVSLDIFVADDDDGWEWSKADECGADVADDGDGEWESKLVLWGLPDVVDRAVVVAPTLALMVVVVVVVWVWSPSCWKPAGLALLLKPLLLVAAVVIVLVINGLVNRVGEEDREEEVVVEVVVVMGREVMVSGSATRKV